MKKVNSVRCHKCNKTLGKEQIRLENPLIVSVKLEKM